MLSKGSGALDLGEVDPDCQPMIHAFFEEWFQSFNTVTKTWSAINLGDKVPYSARSVALNNKQILITGGNWTMQPLVCLNETRIFNIDTKQFDMVAPMNNVRSWHGTCMFQGDVVVLGGHDGKGFITSCERYNPRTNEWTPMPSFSKPRASIGVCSIADRYIYTFGNVSSSTDKDIIEVYDSETNEWTELPLKLPQPLHATTCAALNDNEIMIVGGWQHSNDQNDSPYVYKYNIAENRIDNFSWMTVPRCQTATFYVNRQLFAIFDGDYESANAQTGEVYDFDLMRWDKLPSSPYLGNKPHTEGYYAITYPNPAQIAEYYPQAD